MTAPSQMSMAGPTFICSFSTACYPMRVRDFSRFGYTSVLFPGLDASEDE